MKGRRVLNAWIVGLFFVIVGYVVWGAIFLARYFEIRAGTMRPAVSFELFDPKFRFRECPGPLDYATMRFGDTIALPMLGFGVGALAYEFRGTISAWTILVLSLVGIAFAYAFYRLATKWKRASQDKDWWFRCTGPRSPGQRRFLLGSTKVRISVAGWIHLVYYGLQWAIASLGLWLVFSKGEGLSRAALIGFAGGFAYIGTFIRDQVKGRFD